MTDFESDVRSFISKKCKEGISCATKMTKQGKVELVYYPDRHFLKTFLGQEEITWIKLDKACEYFQNM